MIIKAYRVRFNFLPKKLYHFLCGRVDLIIYRGENLAVTISRTGRHNNNLINI